MGKGGTNPLLGTAARGTPVGEGGGDLWSLRGGGYGQECSGRGTRLRPEGSCEQRGLTQGPVWCPPPGPRQGHPPASEQEGTEGPSPSPARCPAGSEGTAGAAGRVRPQTARAGADLDLLPTAGRENTSSFPSMRKFVDVCEILEVANGVTVLPKDGNRWRQALRSRSTPHLAPLRPVELSHGAWRRGGAGIRAFFPEICSRLRNHGSAPITSSVSTWPAPPTGPGGGGGHQACLLVCALQLWLDDPGCLAWRPAVPKTSTRETREGQRTLVGRRAPTEQCALSAPSLPQPPVRTPSCPESQPSTRPPALSRGAAAAVHLDAGALLEVAGLHLQRLVETRLMTPSQ